MLLLHCVQVRSDEDGDAEGNGDSCDDYDGDGDNKKILLLMTMMIMVIGEVNNKVVSLVSQFIAVVTCYYCRRLRRHYFCFPNHFLNWVLLKIQPKMNINLQNAHFINLLVNFHIIFSPVPTPLTPLSPAKTCTVTVSFV